MTKVEFALLIADVIENSEKYSRGFRHSLGDFASRSVAYEQAYHVGLSIAVLRAASKLPIGDYLFSGIWKLVYVPLGYGELGKFRSKDADLDMHLCEAYQILRDGVFPSYHETALFFLSLDRRKVAIFSFWDSSPNYCLRVFHILESEMMAYLDYSGQDDRHIVARRYFRDGELKLPVYHGLSPESIDWEDALLMNVIGKINGDLE